MRRWQEIGAFERQVELSKGRKPYTFYDGPPFATGTPHYGHLLSSTIKDIIPRYWSMKGRYVERRFGWDTHGVPIEYEIDKKLGMSGKQAVEKLGIAQYNAECRAIVMTYASEWRTTITRLGRWIDFDNDYKVNQSMVDYVSWISAHAQCPRPWTRALWNPCGGYSSNSSTKTSSTVATKSCPIQQPSTLPSATSNHNKTTKTRKIRPWLSPFLSLTILKPASWRGPQHPGHYLLILD